MEERSGKGILRWILIILAVVLVLFLCWKAGWILTGNKNDVSEQEKQEAIQEAVEEIDATMDAEHSTVLDATNEMEGLHNDLQEVHEELQEVSNELRDALK